MKMSCTQASRTVPLDTVEYRCTEQQIRWTVQYSTDIRTTDKLDVQYSKMYRTTDQLESTVHYRCTEPVISHLDTTESHSLFRKRKQTRDRMMMDHSNQFSGSRR